ncbi:RluA family pseudouridine synthase [Rubinisphaera brasiliensis]|uniref:RluA family pseudouridine synthase n=1 Tax=Rubinisphaera brasiliensis TaxID=119 RepID=UPI001C54DF05|nr:RluA family pseudouridine synthase [Rubinisphaera brasiliensis]
MSLLQNCGRPEWQWRKKFAILQTRRYRYESQFRPSSPLPSFRMSFPVANPPEPDGSARSLELTVEPYQSGLRTDAFLVQQLRNYSLWKIQRLAHWGAITIRHQPVDLMKRLYPGDTIQVRLVEPPETVYEPEPFPLEIEYEDAWMLAVNKPPGVIAHPTGNMQSGTLCNYLQAHFDTQSGIPGLLKPGIVHRLDRETSGVMLIAKTHRAHRNFVDAFEHSRVSKTYVALLEGDVAKEEGTIDLPIGQATVDSKVLMSARGDAKNPKPAKTHWRVLKRLGSHTLVAAKPVTGRNHQIRVHFATIGHPLAGDEFYDRDGQFKAATRDSLEEGRRMTDTRCARTGLTRHALHASTIQTAHPITGVWMTIQAGLPADMLAAVLRIEAAGPSDGISRK